MKGLLVKDFYSMKKMYRQILMISALYMTISVFQGDLAFFIGTMMVFVPILSLSSFSYDELSHWNNYALALPIKKNDVVKGKFLYTLLLLLIVAVISLVLIFIMNFFRGNEKTIEYLLTLVLTGSVAIIYISILFPVIFKTSIEKARIVMIAVFLIPFIIILSASKLGFNISFPQGYLGSIIPIICIILLVISVVVLFASYKISCHIFLKNRS